MYTVQSIEKNRIRTLLDSSLTIIIVLLSLRGSAGANILGVFPIEAPSHQVVFDAYMSELHRLGHNVTVYSHFLDIGTEPYRQVAINGDRSAASSSVVDPDYMTMDNMYSPSIRKSYEHMFLLLRKNSEAYAGGDALRELYGQPDDAYDLVVTETCNTDLFLALAERFRAPFIAWTTSPMFVWSADRMAASTHPAYVPVLMSPHGPRMEFAERTYNTLLRLMAFRQYDASSEQYSQDVASKHFARSPPLAELALRTSLLLVDTHHAVWGGRPLPPNVVEVGGLHVRLAKSLKEVRDYCTINADYRIFVLNIGHSEYIPTYANTLQPFVHGTINVSLCT